MNCKLCKYLKEQKDVQQIGKMIHVCKRFPPIMQLVPTQQGLLPAVMFPIISDEFAKDGCGEFQKEISLAN